MVLKDVLEYAVKPRERKTVNEKAISERVVKLESAGFKKAASQLIASAERVRKKYLLSKEKYPVLTKEKIKAFLDRRAEAYNKLVDVRDAGKNVSNSATSELSLSGRGIELMRRRMAPYGQSVLGDFRSIQEEIDRAYGERRNSVESYEQLLEDDLYFGIGSAARRRMESDLRDAFRYASPLSIDRFLTDPDNWFITDENTSFTSSRVKSNKWDKAYTKDYYSYDKDKIGQFKWVETSVELYQDVPPDFVLDRLEEAKKKKLFDQFVVVTVEATPDPLLIGLVYGEDERYVIAQWDDDIPLDEIL